MPIAGGLSVKGRILITRILSLSVHIMPEQRQDSVLDGPLTSTNISNIQLMLKCHYLGSAFTITQPGYWFNVCYGLGN